MSSQPTQSTTPTRENVVEMICQRLADVNMAEIANMPELLGVVVTPIWHPMFDGAELPNCLLLASKDRQDPTLLSMAALRALPRTVRAVANGVEQYANDLITLIHQQQALLQNGQSTTAESAGGDIPANTQ